MTKSSTKRMLVVDIDSTLPRLIAQAVPLFNNTPGFHKVFRITTSH